VSERNDMGDETRVLVEHGGEKRVGAPDDGSVRVSPLDRGLLYGDGVFETVRCYDGVPAFAERHAERLNDALEAVGIGRRFDAWGFKDALAELTDAAEWGDSGGGDGSEDGDGDFYLRVTVTRGERHGVLEPTENEPTVVWTAKPLDAEERGYPPAAVETVETRRPLGTVGEHKTLNYLPNVLARTETSDDADEALMLDADGNVASGTVSNLFVVEGTTVKTPSENVRRGVTREVVLEILEERGYEARETEVVPSELGDADALFLTNSTWGVRRVKEFEDVEYGESEVVESVGETYLNRAVPPGD